MKYVIGVVQMVKTNAYNRKPSFFMTYKTFWARWEINKVTEKKHYTNRDAMWASLSQLSVVLNVHLT
jgi:hypothetical protein